MAADDFRTLAPTFASRRTAALPDAGTAREIQCPRWARRITVWFYASNGSTAEGGKVADSGTDAQVLGNHWVPVTTAGLTWRVAAGRGHPSDTSIFVTGTTNGGYCHLLFEEE